MSWFAALGRRLGVAIRYKWEVFTPQFIAVSGLFATHITGSRILGALMVVWAVDLAYQRGKAAETNRIGAMMNEMVCGERSVEITVRHEHRAAPAIEPESRS